MRLLLLSLLPPGCAPLMVKTADADKTEITWVRERPAECGNAGTYDGCAYRMDNCHTCSIVMPEDAPDWIIAHEFKHCFGYEHAK